MKKISFIIILAIGLMACEKVETGPVLERQPASSSTEVFEEAANSNPEEITPVSDPGTDVITNPEEGNKETKGKSEGDN